jgi:hypothetical protein
VDLDLGATVGTAEDAEVSGREGLLLAVLGLRVGVVVVEATDGTVRGCGMVFGSPAAGHFGGARLVSCLGSRKGLSSSRRWYTNV